MPGSSTLQRGNEIFEIMVYLAVVTVPSVPANGSISQTFPCPNAAIGDLISWNQQGVIAGISIDNVYVSAPGILSFYWTNTTAGILGSGTTPVVLSVARGENVSLGGLASLPNGIY